jgi:hypothetical protein
LLFDQASISAIVVLFGVKGSSVLEFEDFLLDIGSLIVLGVSSISLLEIEFVEVISRVGQQLLLVQKLNNSGVTSSRRSSSR